MKVVPVSMKQSVVDSVFQIIQERLKNEGCSDETCKDVWRHFSTLPARYALSVDPTRHEDVLLHMRLLNEAREADIKAHRAQSPHPGPTPLPHVHVRRVNLGGQAQSGHESPVQAGSAAPVHDKPTADSISIPGKKFHKPAFGSSTNLNAMTGSPGPVGAHSGPRPGGGSLRGSSSVSSRGHSPAPPIPFGSSPMTRHASHPKLGGSGLSGSSGHAPMAGSAGAPGTGCFLSRGRRPHRSCSSLEEKEQSEGEDDEDVDMGSMGSYGSNDGAMSWGHGTDPGALGWEVTVAAPDRHGLLSCMTSALGGGRLDLSIREAHVFSTSDNMALEVFVVEGWDADEPEDLQAAILASIEAQTSGGEPLLLPEQVQLANLKASVEAIGYEDWAVDFQDLEIGVKLSGGSSGRLYRGVYRGQDVAIKVILLADVANGTPVYSDVNGGGLSGSLRAAPATELLQCFKREVAIMRIVRHKNLVQFIGACSLWPRLYIVTELMAGGSVRDLLQRRGGGLEVPAAVRVLRDAARGMDFLHRRGVVHRDLKAANLLIDENEVVKVCDFGVARMLPKPGASPHGSPVGGSATRDLMLVSKAEMTAETGTYRWMAPEVLEHRPYDHKADVYSFGITIWELLTGKIPHSGLTPLQAAIGVVQRGLRPDIPAHCPPKLVALTKRCWHYEPAERPEFSEILTTLEDCLRPTVAPPLWRKAIFGGRSKA